MRRADAATVTYLDSERLVVHHIADVLVQAQHAILIRVCIRHEGLELLLGRRPPCASLEEPSNLSVLQHAAAVLVELVKHLPARKGGSDTLVG